MEFPQVNSGLVALVIALISFIGWLSRLESKTNSNGRDIEKQERRLDNHDGKISELDDRLMDKLSRIEQIVANIQGQLSK